MEVVGWGAGGAQFFEMEGFDGASGAAFPRRLGASHEHPKDAIGPAPTLRDRGGAL